jgi:hypothetical protein
MGVDTTYFMTLLFIKKDFPDSGICFLEKMVKIQKENQTDNSTWSFTIHVSGRRLIRVVPGLR